MQRRRYTSQDAASNYHYRRARAARVSGDFSGEEWATVMAFYGGRCLVCGTTEDVTLDHVAPLSRGGENAAHNLAPLCRRHNSTKGARYRDFRDPLELVQLLLLLEEYSG